MQGLTVDPHGRAGGYDLIVMSSDLTVPANIRRRGWRGVVLIQEGILDPGGLPFEICRRVPFAPRWLAGTSTTGLSHSYERFCVASEGYRDLFIRNGIPAERIAVTGIPNFDDCRRFETNDFPHRGFVLVCSSDARETFKKDDRRAFVERCVAIAAGRLLIFKLHPNENAARATAEIAAWAPGALVYSSGCAEEMIARCDVLITQYSSTVFVGLALGKEVHSYFDLAELRRLMPIQNRSAARNIAVVCREVLAAEAPAPCVSGDPFDLLDRHYQAALELGADVVVKIPSDCPLIDSGVIDRVLGFYLANRERYDYVSNLHPGTWPDGNDVEVVPVPVLAAAWQEAERPWERAFLWERPERFRCGNVKWVEWGRDLSRSHRFTIDYREDYDFIAAVYAALWRPELLAINARWAGVNWYRHHLDELRTVGMGDTRLMEETL